MKYVMFRDVAGGLWPVIFPDQIAHSQVKATGCSAVSAGFVNAATGEVYGRSVSLKLRAWEEDGLWVRLALDGNDAGLVALNAAQRFGADKDEEGNIEHPTSNTERSTGGSRE